MVPLAAGEIDAVLDAAKEFQGRLRAVKGSIDGIDWYHHPSLSALEHLNATLTERRRYLLNLIGTGPVLDVGCADGDLSFFLESLGCRVRAVDYRPTNYNKMRGIAALKQALSSSVEISEVDLDAQFKLEPEERYTAAFCLGLLYHLKNPFYFLETLANHAAYCFLSTRIARWTPDRRVNLSDLPVAYLLKKGEANADPTNFWIFSETGLRELCDRAGWEICDFATFGDSERSDPVRPDADERAFCLLKSRRVAAIDLGTELLEGWYGLEPGGWRWTRRRFSAAFRNPARNVGGRILLRFWLHQALLDAFGTVTLTVRAGGTALASRRFDTSGTHSYEAELPAGALTEDRVVIAFEIDRALPPSTEDVRELGLAVTSMEFC